MNGTNDSETRAARAPIALGPTGHGEPFAEPGAANGSASRTSDPILRQEAAIAPIAPIAPGAVSHMAYDPGEPSGIELARGALRTLLETTEYVSDRTARLSTNAIEGINAGETLGAVARQIRTLSSNTSLEASRLGGSATVGEIARQMRLLSQQVSALSEHVSSCLRSQNVALGELSGAVDALLADTAATQALLTRDAIGASTPDTRPDIAQFGAERSAHAS